MTRHPSSLRRSCPNQYLEENKKAGIQNAFQIVSLNVSRRGGEDNGEEIEVADGSLIHDQDSEMESDEIVEGDAASDIDLTPLGQIHRLELEQKRHDSWRVMRREVHDQISKWLGDQLPPNGFYMDYDIDSDISVIDSSTSDDSNSS